MTADMIHALMAASSWLAIISAVMFVASLAIIPWYLRRLPADFFLELKKTPSRKNLSIGRIITLVTLNILGIILILAGIIMLFVPGQGIITILVGLLIMSFPGKTRLINLLISADRVQTSLNWLRQKLSCPPFIWK